MTNSLDDPLANLSLDHQLLVGDVCERYETALRSGARPQVEDFIDGYSGALRKAILGELLVLAFEDELCQMGAIDISRAVARFPDAEPSILSAAEEAKRCAAARGGMNSAAPDKLGRFRLIRILGQGAVGTVFLACDPAAGREVALKVLHPAALFTPELRQRFLREAKLAGKLDHPHLVKIHEAGEDGIVCYIARDYVPGGTLAEWLECRPRNARLVPPLLAAELTATLAAAMQHAHDLGVLHCDLKPANILLHESNPDRPLIADFGLARLMGDVSELSRTGQIFGTPAYMAPEQASGQRKQVGPATDVYGLGATLYELLTGQPPFPGDHFVGVLQRVLAEEPVRPGAVNPAVPRALETICLKCLEKAPHRRYLTAADLAADLRRFLAAKPIAARPVSLLERIERWRRREPTLARMAIALILTAIGALAGMTFLWQRAKQQADEARSAQRQAEENLELTRQVTAEMVKVTRSEALQAPAARNLLANTLVRAEAVYLQLLLKEEANSDAHIALADVYFSQGYVYWIWGQLDKAELALANSVNHWKRASPDDPRLREHRFARLKAESLLIKVLRKQGRLADAAAVARDTLAPCDQLYRELPDSEALFHRLGMTGALGSLLMEQRQFSEARNLMESALAHCDDPGAARSEVRLIQARIDCLYILSGIYEAEGRTSDSRAAWVRAYEHWKSAVDDLARSATSDSDRVKIRDLFITPGLSMTANLRHFSGDLEKAQEVAQRARSACEEYVREAPEQPSRWTYLSEAWSQIAKNNWKLNREAVAPALREALAAQKRAVDLDPSSVEYNIQLADRYIALGRCLCDRGELAEAETCFLAPLQLCPQDANVLAKAAEEMKELASEVGRGRTDLTPPEVTQRQRLLAHATKLANASHQASK